ncbi:MAG: hypothetical protein K9M03_03275 [Kiritimatiellales bacterium]|nr:hypothetical protein [Kiritimatiellales bacterium]
MDTCLHYWNEELRIIKCISLPPTYNHDIQFIEASDDTKAIILVDESVMTCDISDMQSFITTRLQRYGYKPHFIQNNGVLYLHSINPLESHIRAMFPDASYGIIVLINGKEPGSYPLNIIHVEEGDVVSLLYRITTIAS